MNENNMFSLFLFSVFFLFIFFKIKIQNNRSRRGHSWSFRKERFRSKGIQIFPVSIDWIFYHFLFASSFAIYFLFFCCSFCFFIFPVRTEKWLYFNWVQWKKQCLRLWKCTIINYLIQIIYVSVSPNQTSKMHAIKHKNYKKEQKNKNKITESQQIKWNKIQVN